MSGFVALNGQTSVGLVSKLLGAPELIRNNFETVYLMKHLMDLA